MATTVPNNRESTATVCARGSATVHVPTDRARVVFGVRSQKKDAAEALDSINRRIKYISSVLATHDVLKSDHLVTRSMDIVDGEQLARGEVHVEFRDKAKCERAVALVLDKLAPAVVVLQQEYFCSAELLERASRRSARLAMEDARAKAYEMVKTCKKHLGQPLVVSEEAPPTAASTTGAQRHG
eukprot:m.312364 g.312364  ORF g.312364 m.312364 type:complete len:184 (-) comp30154_c0_seq1:184-735(-)